jgi:hypothetical protein
MPTAVPLADRADRQRLANRKNTLLLELLRRQGVDVSEGSVRFVEAAHVAGLRRARRGAVTATASRGHRKEERHLSAPLRVFG